MKKGLKLTLQITAILLVVAAIGVVDLLSFISST